MLKEARALFTASIFIISRDWNKREKIEMCSFCYPESKFCTLILCDPLTNCPIRVKIFFYLTISAFSSDECVFICICVLFFLAFTFLG